MSLSIRKILVTIDGSENSKKAAEYAGSLAKKYNAQLIILYVLYSELGFAYSNPLGVTTPKGIKDVLETQKKDVENWFDEIRSKLKNTNISVTDKIIISVSSIVGEIIEFADKEKVDLITIVVPYGKDYDPPDDIKDCVTLFRTGKNYGDLNSLIPTIMREGDADTIIITVGDDTIYGIDFIEKLLNDKFKSSSDKNIIYNNSQEFIDIKKGAVFISDIFNDDFTNPPKDCDANKWVNNYLKNTPKERINYRENHKKM